LIIHTMPQRSAEWFAVRLGKITGTSFQTMANGKAAGIEKLCVRIANEIRLGVGEENGYTNANMQHGIDTELLAISAYETTVFKHVTQVGFVEIDEYTGFSPDGLVGDDGGLEVKCPTRDTQTGYLIRGDAWKEYRWQVQGALWGSKRDWWDFVSYCPVLPPDEQLLVERVLPDEKMFGKLTSGAEYCKKRIVEILEKFEGKENGPKE